MVKRITPMKAELIRMAHKGIPLGVKDIVRLTGLTEKTVKDIVYKK